MSSWRCGPKRTRPGPPRGQLQAAITRTTFTFTFASALALALLFGVHLLSERSRNQLRRHAAWLSTTLRSIGDAVIATDGQGRVIFMNAAAEGLTAWTHDEAQGKPLDDVFRITNEDTGNPDRESRRQSATRRGASSASPIIRSSRRKMEPGGPSRTVPPRSKTGRAFKGSCSSFVTRPRLGEAEARLRETTSERMNSWRCSPTS